MPAFTRVAVLDLQRRAVRHLVALALAAVVVLDHHLAGARDDDELALGVGHVAHQRREADGARGLALELRRRGGPRRGAADVERPHRELRARLADRLRGDDADRFADVDEVAAAEVAAVALGAQAVARVAGERRAHLDFVDAEELDLLDLVLAQQRAGVVERLLRFRVHDVGGDGAAEDALAQRLDHFAALDQRLHRHAVGGPAIILGDDEVLRDVDEAAREVARVRGLQRRVGEALARAVRADEVLQHVQALAEVRRDRRLDDRAVRLRHQSAHPGELPDLRRRAARARVGHHVDRVERLLLDRLAVAVDHVDGAELRHHRLRDVVAGAAPDVDHLVVALALRDQARGVLRLDLLHLRFGLVDDLVLLLRHQHVVGRERDAAARREAVTRLHQLVGEDHGLAQPAAAEARVDDLRDLLLLERLVDGRERQAGRQDLGEQRAAHRRLEADDLVDGLAARGGLGLLQPDVHLRVQLDLARLVGALDFGDVGEEHPLALRVDLVARRVVEAQHDVLRRHDARLAVRRQQHVVRRQHQRARLHLRLERQRHVDGHLVAVEVGVERRADERVQLDRLAFDQHRLERLDAEAVQRRRAVQHHRVLADHVLEDVPDDGLLRLDHLLRGLDRGREAHRLELVEDERLEELERHQLRQAALVQLQLRADDDDRAARVVDALAEQVLAEASALALDHVGERLQRTLVGAGHRLAAAAVVEQRVDGFLQHPLLVADDDVRRLELEQALQPVVPVDHAAIQVVQVGGREAAAVQRDQRAQLRRQHRQHLEDHPLGLDARLVEGLEHLEALGDLLDLGVGAGRLELVAQLLDLVRDVERLQELADALGAHRRREVVAVLLDLREVVVLGQELRAVERRQAGVGDDVRLEVQHALDVAQRHVEHHAHPRRQALQEPDVRDRARELDVAHPLAAHLGERDFDAALLADHAAVLQALVLAAQALVVLDRPEDLRAEEAVALGLERPVVDRLRLLDFAVRPRADLLRRGEADLDRVEFLFLRDLLEQIEQCFHCDSLAERWALSVGRKSRCIRRCAACRRAGRETHNLKIVPGRCRWRASGFPSPAR